MLDNLPGSLLFETMVFDGEDGMAWKSGDGCRNEEMVFASDSRGWGTCA
jgi:hypothetical protein